MQAAANRFMWGTYAAAAVLLVVHVVCFTVFSGQVDKQSTYIYEVASMGDLTGKVQLLSVMTLRLQRCRLPFNAGTPYCAPLPTWKKALSRDLDAAEAAHEGLYLGFSHLRAFDNQKLYRMWTDTNSTQAQKYSDVTGTFSPYNTSIWALGNDWISAGREVMYWSDKLLDKLNTTRQWKFVQENGPNALYMGYRDSLDLMAVNAFSKMQDLHAVLLVLLLVEAVAINLLVLAYQFVLFNNIGAQHMKSFATFLAVPSAMMRTMASRPCKVDEDDEDDADSDDEEQQPAVQALKPVGGNSKSVRMFVDTPGGDQGAVAASGAYGYGNLADLDTQPASRRRLGPGLWAVVSKRTRALYRNVVATDQFRFNGKKLLPHHWTLAKLMTPFLLWELMVVVIFATSFVKLETVQDAIIALAAGNRVLYRSTRIRYYGNKVVHAETSEQRATAQSTLLQQVEFMDSEWKALLYGGTSSYSATSDFPMASPATIFTSPEHSYIYFRNHDCLRSNQTTCPKPDDRFYQVVHSGLNAMVQRMLHEARQLADDPVSQLTVRNSHFEYIWRPGGFDLNDGLRDSTYLYSTDTLSKYEAVRQLHVVLLLLTIFMLLAYLLLMVRPYRKRVADDAGRVAGLLSLLPPECDVEGQVALLLNKYAAAGAQHSKGAESGAKG